MSEFTSDEKLNRYAKESRNIEYSTKIFEETTEKREKPKIVLRELIKYEGEKEEHVWAMILKYKTLGDVPQEVIMGTLGNTSERKEKAIEIINLIRGQLEENVTSEAGYEHYEKLSQYVQSENIPFRLTMEGTDILSSKSKENIPITRTCFENRQGKIESIFAKEDLEQMKKERNSELSQYIRQKKVEQRWKERREKILDSFSTEEKRQNFLKGERITQFIQETDEDIEAKKNIVADYLLEAFEEDNSDENPKLSLLKGYLMIKEKGFAIDTKRTLETLENRYYKDIKEKKGEVSLEDYDKIKVIDDYKTFFDLVKAGKDWNARLLALKLKKIDFNGLKKMFEKFKGNDKELLQYFDLKEKMIQEVQTDTIEVDYHKYDSVKELYQFLSHSSIREKTKADDEHVIFGVYEHVKREIIESNMDVIELYNNYAEKSNIPVCQLPQTKKISKERPVSNVVKKICEDIEAKGLDNSENKDEQR